MIASVRGGRERPLISIVSVTYLDLDGVMETVDSIQAQRGVESSCIEHVVVDGGTDGFPKEIVGNIFVRVISEQDQGLYDAMNKGTLAARGDYVMFLNGGDILYNSFVLKSLVDFLGGLELDEFVFGRASMVGDELGEERFYPSYRYGGGNIDQFLESAFPCHQSMLIPRWFCIEQLYDTRYRISADAKFKKLALKKMRVAFFDSPIVSFDLCGISSSTKTLSALGARFKESKMLYDDGLSSRWELLRSFFFHVTKYFTANVGGKRALVLFRNIFRGE